MDTKTGKLLKAVKQWTNSFAIPALVIALLIAGLFFVGYQLFGPAPLDAAIKKDLQRSATVTSEPAAAR